MARGYKQTGETLTYTATADIASGDVVQVGARFGVALVDIPDTKAGTVKMDGVWTLPKLSTDVVTQGALLYWDASAGHATITAGAGPLPLLGYAHAAAGNGATVVDVNING